MGTGRFVIMLFHTAVEFLRTSVADVEGLVGHAASDSFKFFASLVAQEAS